MRRPGWLIAVVALLTITACTPPNLPAPIAPTGGTSVSSAPPAPGTLVVGLDGTSGPITGFNPYAVADYSPASQAVASLVLPSAFVMAADGSVGTDADVVDWVAVTSLNPFTVTYLLDRKASWSDGTPITAEDFSYLRDQLLVQPGTVASAGYRLISAIRSRDAGKTVDVEFSAPFPDWRSLFSPLLPSHLLKDSPGGWSSALDSDLPLSGNRYRMTSYDPVTGQVALARNDKYWATPPGPAAVVLRLGRPSDLLAAFNRGDVQALWFAPDAATAQDIADQVPGDQRTALPTPSSMQLVMNSAAGPTADVDIRTAIAAGLDPTALAGALTAGWADGGRTVTSQVALPLEASGDDGEATAGPPIVTNDRVAAQAALTRAGYSSNGLYVARAGQILRLRLGYPSGRPRLAAAARLIQQQLGGIGIEVDLFPDAAPDLIENNVAAGTLDLALIDLTRGSTDSVAAATAFGCPRTDPSGIGSTAAPAGDGSPPTTPAAAPVPRTGNLSGYCGAGTQRVLVEGLTGQLPVAEADPGLWVDLPVFPLIQPQAVFAVAPTLRPVLVGDHSGWSWTGPLAGLAGWPVR
ncbi:ABC transporter family substrate-binding protein [Nakamurella sp.]|uniref:ABC transporter family substrate-binding protein n=1 Tax=Nakamurella sp. TaxID=1869182 RepID=UPI0037833558